MAFTFRVSKRRDKKYDAVFDDDRVVSFGGIKRSGEPYPQYRDRTPLKAYSEYDHGDKKRRDMYYKRHNKDYPKFSADWFSKEYLWT